ncbi:Two component transcriptional regulator, LuxR family [Nostocoides australiense Ben110]|uniref:Two component transcriptional regulator, LuxR family n=1 Tax=Nostocoides australiense Ben110 TaxID=1193182 RepID=W6JX75_9MICO|nr:Two component transcriptional regulator, LuxR family [Tetrasphaera australiensis Ben110]
MRVVVADDSVLFREGLVRLLAEKGHEVLDAVGDATALQEAVERNQPDLAVIDVRMPPAMESDGAKSAATLRARHPELGLLLLSQHIELHHVLPLVGTPGFGYLLKDRVLNLADFTAAAERVATGGSALDPAVVQALVLTRSGSALDDLTERELDVLGQVAEGLSNTAIAERLVVSERTVEAHIRSVFTKLGLSDEGTNRRVLAVLRYLEAH